MANRRALLVMTSPLGQVVPKLANYLPAIQARHPGILYVHLTQNNDNIGLLSSTITNIYQNESAQCDISSLDLRVTFNDSSLNSIERPIHDVFLEHPGDDSSISKLFKDSHFTILDPIKVN